MKKRVITSAELPELLLLLYPSPPADAAPRWRDFLTRLVELTGSDGAALLAHDLRTGQTHGLWTDHHDASEIEALIGHSLAAGVISDDSSHPPSSVRLTEFRMDRDNRSRAFYTILVELGVEGGFCRRLCLSRGDASVASAGVELLTLLVPHLQNAVRLEATLAALGDLKRFLDDLQIPVFLLDRDACVLEMSPRAGRLAHAAAAPTSGPLRIVDGANHRQRQLHLRFEGGAGSTLAGEIASLGALPPYRLLRLAGQKTLALLSKAPAASIVRPDDRYLLAILEAQAATGVDDGQSSAAFQEATARLYRLTPAETRFVQTLVETGALDLTVERLGITRNTARTQMASIFSKTGTRRQGQVIQLFSLLLRITHMGDDGSDESP